MKRVKIEYKTDKKEEDRLSDLPKNHFCCSTIAFSHTMKRVKIEHKGNGKEEDRLSDLPDCVLLHILSFSNAKQAVQTCILSTRWKHLWKRLLSSVFCLVSSRYIKNYKMETSLEASSVFCLVTLTLNSGHCRYIKNYINFVSSVLSLRDGSTALHALALDFQGNQVMKTPLLEWIVNYAVSHNVQRLHLSVDCNINTDPPYFPACFFSCQTLRSLTLSGCPVPFSGVVLFPNSLNLPALTRLSLEAFAFRAHDDGFAEPFSAFKRLNSLTIRYCTFLHGQNLYISSDTVSNLTIESHYKPRNCCKIKLSAPSLCNFAYIGTPVHKLCGRHPGSLQHVKIDADMFSNCAEPPSNLLSLFLELADIKSLTVTSTTLQVLSLVPNLLKIKLPSLHNLKSLKVKMEPLSFTLSEMLIEANLAQLPAMSLEETSSKLQETFKVGTKSYSSIPDGTVEFLLQNSPSTKARIIY